MKISAYSMTLHLAKIKDKSVYDSVTETFEWEHLALLCPFRKNQRTLCIPSCILVCLAKIKGKFKSVYPSAPWAKSEESM